MDMFSGLNAVSVLIICIFAIPIVAGIIWPLNCGRIHRSFLSLLGSVTLLASIILSVCLTKIILTGGGNFILTGLYQVFPGLEAAVADRAIWVYPVFIVALTLLIDGIFSLLTLPMRRYAFPWMARRISCGLDEANGFVRRTVSGLWQLPRSLWLVLVFSLLLNFYTGFFNTSVITEAANTSVPYQLVQGSVIQPLLGSSVVKDIQVIVNDTFEAAEGLNDAQNGSFPLYRYINGVSLQDAVQSSPEIDDMAKQIVGSETDDKRKAHLIYLWICKNVKYDNSKAAAVLDDPSSVSSGAIVAYTTRTGICFDFSCLYVAMCRAVGVGVRFIIGLGFSGSVWGDHAWNQAYYPKEDRWINVDTTFGSSGINYFDRTHFYLDHKDSSVQGEWQQASQTSRISSAVLLYA